MPLASTADVISIIGYPNTEEMQDAIDIVLPLAESLVVDFTGYASLDFEENTAYNYNGGVKLIIFDKPLVSLTKVEYNVESTLSLITTEVVKIPLNPKHFYRGLRIKDADQSGYNPEKLFDYGYENIVVTGDWGFETVPVQVKTAIAYTVKYIFNIANFNELIKAENIASSNKEILADNIMNKSFSLPAFAQAMLVPFKKAKL